MDGIDDEDGALSAVDKLQNRFGAVTGNRKRVGSVIRFKFINISSLLSPSMQIGFNGSEEIGE